MFNQAVIVGRLGQDPELRNMRSGEAVVNVTVATTSGYTDRTSGEKKESTEWHRVVAYGPTAEAIARLAKKGTLMLFEGSMHTREYTDKQGLTKKSTELKARVSRVLAGGKNEGHAGMAEEEDVLF
jgi:single-strand DNA-binding protein